MFLILTSESTTEPLTLDEIKLFLRLSTSATTEDTLLSALAITARKEAQQKTCRQLVTAKHELKLDDFPGEEIIRMPYAPMIYTGTSDVTITYLNGTGVATLPSSDYTVSYTSEPAEIYPEYEHEWPTDVVDRRNAVSISYRCGYSTSNPVPENIKTWMKMRIASLYENREMVTETKMSDMPGNFIDGLLDPYLVTI